MKQREREAVTAVVCFVLIFLFSIGGCRLLFPSRIESEKGASLSTSTTTQIYYTLHTVHEAYRHLQSSTTGLLFFSKKNIKEILLLSGIFR
jgi:hypothetical protein